MIKIKAINFMKSESYRTFRGNPSRYIWKWYEFMHDSVLKGTKMFMNDNDADMKVKNIKSSDKRD